MLAWGVHATLAQSTSTSSTSTSSTGTSSSSSSTSVSSAATSTTSAPNFAPSGGLGTNASTIPQYVPLSDYDFQSLNLALNQEWLELDLFHHGLALFSTNEFEAAGINAQDRFLIQYMAEQEAGHATLLSNMLGPTAAKPCNYTYNFTTVRDFVDFSQKATRWGEAAVYGFLEHLDSRAAAELLLQSITIGARKQMIFRQLEGLFPMPIWFLPAITQSMAWTLLSPHIISCPAGNPHVQWQNFPALNITNNPSAVAFVNTTTFGNDTAPGITQNRTVPLSAPGQQIQLSWELPGNVTGYNNSFITNTTAGPAQFAAWISQLNTTYTPLSNVNGTNATTTQPPGFIFGNNTAPVINGTMFVLITDTNLTVTPFNISLLNAHVVAGPAVYQAG
ncbi:Rds1 protein [Tricholoma matsutake]|nr:Rds1 protein [Tricholoma matsutake 945]